MSKKENDLEKNVIDQLSSVLLKIIDAKEEKNITPENKSICLTDLWRLLNDNYIQILKNKKASVDIFNKYQFYYFHAINYMNKNVKFPLIMINSNLWRCYNMVLFKNSSDPALLKEMTGWDAKELDKEVMTEDMKILFLSMIKAEKEPIK